MKIKELERWLNNYKSVKDRKDSIVGIVLAWAVIIKNGFKSGDLNKFENYMCRERLKCRCK